MTGYLAVFSVFCVISIVSARNSLPSYIKKCSLSDPNLNKCWTDNANLAVPYMVKGDKKYNFPSVQPFRIEEISIESTGSLHMGLKNIEVYGLDQINITDTNFDSKTFNLTIHAIIPNMIIKGQYETKGHFLILSLEGTGPTTMHFKNLNIVYDTVFERHMNGNVSYLKVNRGHLDYSLEHIRYHFDNLFNGNKEIGDEMNKVLNENWKVLYEELKPQTSVAISTIVNTVLSGFLDGLPEKDMFYS